MGDLIEVGYDIINPVQTTAYQIDPETLKKNLKKILSFGAMALTPFNKESLYSRRGLSRFT